MDPCRTPASTGYSCEDFQSKTTKIPFTEKGRNKTKYLTEIPLDLSVWRIPVCQTLLKDLDISSTRVQVVPDLLKALVILSDTAARRSAVDEEDLKP